MTYNYHQVPHITDLRHMIETSCRIHADRPAFLVKSEKGGDYREITYAKLKEDIDALGTKLLDMGLADAHIAVMGENCYQWVTAYYAVTNGTGVVVPLDKELPKEDLNNLLKFADCRAIFFTNTYRDYFKDTDIEYKFEMNMYHKTGEGTENALTGDSKEIKSWYSLIEDGNRLLQAGNSAFSERPLDPDEMRIILFTSATTDDAKGVMLSHRNIMSNIMDTCRIALVTPEDRSLSILPIHHTFESTMGMSLFLYRGASIAFYEGLKYITQNMLEAKPTYLIGVPLVFEAIYKKIWKQAEKTGQVKKLNTGISLAKNLRKLGIDKRRSILKAVYENFGGRLRVLITGAAGIDPNVLRGYEDLGFTMQQGYGLTETSPLVTGMMDFHNNLRYKKAGSSGPVVSCGEMKIDNAGEDGIGEILFKGPNLMLGYYKRPDLTAKAIVDGWFHTGDLGFVDDIGWLYITGRKKNVIVTKTGKNIYPEELEEYMHHIKYIEEALVHGVERDDDMVIGAQIRPAYDVIYEEFGEGYPEDDVFNLLKKAVSDLNDKLPIYKHIRQITIRADDFVRTTTKKIKRHRSTENLDKDAFKSVEDETYEESGEDEES